MFSNSDFEMIGFNPCPETARPVSDFSGQTVSRETNSQETQTGLKHSVVAQTVPEEATNFAENPVSYDADKLLKFLKRIVPHLEEELKSGTTLLKTSQDDSNFDQYEDLTFNKETEEEYAPTKMLIRSNGSKNKVISDLSWDHVGLHLAVSYSEKYHEGWCCHESSVEVYNTDFNEIRKNFKTSSCVRCISFFPDWPSPLAAGLHNGDIVIWNFSVDTVPFTKVKGNCGTEAHSDAVSFLRWNKNENEMKKSLVSVGRDGKIIFWKVSPEDMTYEAHERFLISNNHISSNMGISNGYLEVLHVSFWTGKKFEFVVAAVGGAILHCSSRTAKSLPSTPDCRDPVLMSYEPHKGIVTSVSCLQGSELFASCGTDSEIHIHKSEVVAPLHVIHTEYPVMGIDWTLKRCLLSWGCSPKVELHKVNVEEGRHFSVKLTEVESEISRLVWNPTREETLALVNKTGEIVVIQFLSVLATMVCPEKWLLM